MKFDTFSHLFEDQGYFDIAMAAQMSGERRHTLTTQLHRWCKAGKLVPLRRGMYAFADQVRRGAVNPAELANHLYKPSYLSTYWALGYYGLIPERVVAFTSVTTRVPREFENALGLFRYSNLKRDAFFGYVSTSMDGAKVLLAEPEKALLDLWHLEKGEWDRARMTAMRFQSTDVVDRKRLQDYAARFEAPRLRRAVDTWQSLESAVDAWLVP
jgi:predicted transcriptional regulator of viral defense system